MNDQCPCYFHTFQCYLEAILYVGSYFQRPNSLATQSYSGFYVTFGLSIFVIGLTEISGKNPIFFSQVRMSPFHFFWAVKVYHLCEAKKQNNQLTFTSSPRSLSLGHAFKPQTAQVLFCVFYLHCSLSD